MIITLFTISFLHFVFDIQNYKNLNPLRANCIADFVRIIPCHRNTILKTTMKIIPHWTLDKEKLQKTVIV